MQFHPWPLKACNLLSLILSLAVGIAIGAIATRSLAGAPPPTKHKGLQVTGLGVISETSMRKQIGLSGYKMQLRAITIEPGGQIAKHSHENRPGLVKVISGRWMEGRESGEVDYGSDRDNAILEDANRIHWFWNRGGGPATAIVCDIVPAS